MTMISLLISFAPGRHLVICNSQGGYFLLSTVRLNDEEALKCPIYCTAFIARKSCKYYLSQNEDEFRWICHSMHWDDVIDVIQIIHQRWIDLYLIIKRCTNMSRELNLSGASSVMLPGRTSSYMGVGRFWTNTVWLWGILRSYDTRVVCYWNDPQVSDSKVGSLTPNLRVETVVKLWHFFFCMN